MHARENTRIADEGDARFGVTEVLGDDFDRAAIGEQPGDVDGAAAAPALGGNGVESRGRGRLQCG